MRHFIRLITGIIVISTLLSCTTTAPFEEEKKDAARSTSDVLFEAWRDDAIDNAAVAKLIRQADVMMKYKQWDEAQGKLERTLRVSISYAPAWSRLSWLSLRAARHNKAIQLAQRSNSYTSSVALQSLNWTFIRDANRLLGNTTEVDAANFKLRQLEDAGSSGRGDSW